MGSLRVPAAIEKRVTLRADGKTLGPYLSNRSCATDSVSPLHDFDCASTVGTHATLTSNGNDRALCFCDYTMGQRPGNVSCSPR